jgi:undecaprenyl-diphosphatase
MLYVYLLIFVQIVLESLPVSSSGHVHLLEALFSYLGYAMNDYKARWIYSIGDYWAVDTFMHMLHGPTAIIVALFFKNRWMILVRHPMHCRRILVKIILLTGCADLMTSIFFIAFKRYQLIALPLSVGFLITAVLLFSLRWRPHLCLQASLNLKTALMLGIIQGIALLPGISRLAAVFVSASWLGFSSRKAFEITWLIQWPLIFVAAIHGFYCMICMGYGPLLSNPGLLMTVGLSSLISFFLLYVVAYLAYTNRWWWFSFYMIVPLILCILLSI